MRRWAALSLLVAGLGACATLPLAQGFQVPPGAYRYEPYAIYATWLDEVNDCAEVDGHMEDLEWWAVPRQWFYLYGGLYLVGYFDKLPEPDRIYLVEWDRENEGLVKHELLHQVADTVGAHPSPPYEYCAPRWHDGAIWRRE